MATPYPPIDDYALIGDCHCSALVCRDGSIDWCCMPRVDSPSCFGRLLDRQRGGFCAITPAGGVRFQASRRYVPETMVLETTFTSAQGEARVLDCFAMRIGGREEPRRQLLRVVEGVRGKMDLCLEIVPRFDYGDIRPWFRRVSHRAVAAIGGATGLMIACDADLKAVGDHDLQAQVTVAAGERVRLSVQYFAPERLDASRPEAPKAEDIDRRLQATVEWWQQWAAQASLRGPDRDAALRSALVLKALTNAPTGAIAAAPTTSLPEQVGGARNWDYRYSWIRDSAFTVRSLAEIGFLREADGFRRFVQRSAAGSAHDLQIMYGVGGERRLTEVELGLEGYRGSAPVRVGNGAAQQVQLDAYGELMLLSWRWYKRGHLPDEDYWRFLVDLVDTAAERWRQADRGIWEVRGDPCHFVHSKALCWAALDRGTALARALGRPAPVERWAAEAAEVRHAIETRGYDASRGVFTQAFDTPAMDAALLLLPNAGFVDYRDERMVRTVDAVAAELDSGGLLLRYRPQTGVDGLEGEEGVFLCCSFWLAECLARQGRLQRARAVFERAAGAANDLGLFSEEWDPKTGHMLGNFPQGLTHLSHIAAAIAIDEAAALLEPQPHGDGG